MHKRPLFAATLLSFFVPALFGACVGDDPVTAGGDAATTATATGTGTVPPAPLQDAAVAADTSVGVDAAGDARVVIPPTAIATLQDGPYALAVTSQSVAFLTATELRRCPIGACPAPTVLAEDVIPTGLARAYPLDANENDVHWFSGRTGQSGTRYYKCPLAGCFGKVAQPALTDATSTLENPSQLTIGSDGKVRISQKFDVTTCESGVCTPIACVSADSVRSFFWDAPANTVFWTHTTDPGGLYRCTPGGARPTQLHANAGNVMSVEGDRVFVMNAILKNIVSCPKAGCGGAPPVFVENEPDMTSMVTTATAVYWTGGSDTAADGYVKSCPLTGCTGGKRIIASTQGRPTSIRARDGKIFWVNRGIGANSGSVMYASD